MGFQLIGLSAYGSFSENTWSPEWLISCQPILYYLLKPTFFNLRLERVNSFFTEFKFLEHPCPSRVSFSGLQHSAYLLLAAVSNFEFKRKAENKESLYVETNPTIAKSQFYRARLFQTYLKNRTSENELYQFIQKISFQMHTNIFNFVTRKFTPIRTPADQKLALLPPVLFDKKNIYKNVPLNIIWFTLGKWLI